jgi:hypothetical protein
MGLAVLCALSLPAGAGALPGDAAFGPLRRAGAREPGARGDRAGRAALEHPGGRRRRYTGRAGSRSVRLRVAKAGRELRGFSASVATLCPGLSPGQFTTQIGTAAIARIRVAPDGRFVAASTPRRDTAIQVRGRLRHRKVTRGRVKLSIGACSGNAAFSAARAG